MIEQHRRAFLTGCAVLGLAIGVLLGLPSSGVPPTAPPVVWQQKANPSPETSAVVAEPTTASTAPLTGVVPWPSRPPRSGARTPVARTVASTPQRTREDTISTQPEQPAEEDPVPPPAVIPEPAPADEPGPPDGPPLAPIPVGPEPPGDETPVDTPPPPG